MTTDPTQAGPCDAGRVAGAPDGRRVGPRDAQPPAVQPGVSIRRKLLWWTIVFVAVPTLVCAHWLSSIARQYMTHSHAQNVASLGQAIAASLGNAMGESPPASAAATLDALSLDPRLSFVIVTDNHHHPLHRRMADASAWADYTAWAAGTASRVTVDQPIVLGRYEEVIVQRVPIWASTGGSQDRRLAGFVTLALREPSLAAAVAQMRLTQYAAALLVCALCVPLVMWAVNRWTAPLTALLEATHDLSHGRRVQPVAIHTRDELGLLASAFNDMAGNLQHAQAELREINDQLEQKVSQRTAALQRAKAHLESEIEDKNQFLRAVSHDLGAPLRNISGLAAMLLVKHRAALADDAVNKLERIRANVNTQVELISELMELSRLRSQTGRRVAVDLGALVESLRTGLSYDLEKSNITLTVESPLPTVIADPTRLRQVFQNLLDNAVKYMLDAPTRRVAVSHRVEPEEFVFSVSDTGSGIPEKDRPHLFEVFRRGTSQAVSGVPGRGVGLAGVKAIIDHYRGRIWADSAVGGGTTFHFTLARSLVDPQAVRPEVQHVAE